ncbi:MAG: 4'-phosphopantetheinyl transferase superfamily protein [Candidatus Promineifilaceae bacterium]|nr:4'-phosphopantetheinyl transferase superfamily protein [Candidatus Promineifilaceae bacterium]
MIDWLITKAADHPELLRGVPPAGMLSADEAVVFGSLKVTKRRQDWLLGRWTVKQLLQEAIRKESGQAVPHAAMSILAAKDGAPTVQFAADYARYESRFTISISHSHKTAFCAVLQKPDWPMGVDLEWIEKRPAQFAEQFFTEKERAFLKQTPAYLTDVQITALWSGKEAALKAVRHGLRLDTRCVECHFGIVEQAPREWTRFHIQWDQQAADKSLPRLQGWWQAADDYVLTMAIKEE